MRVAATQIRIEFADVKENLHKAIRLIQEAAENKASLIVLPEFFTSAIAINPLMDEIPSLNRKFKVIETLTEMAGDLGISICGSMLQEIGDDIYNSVFIIESGSDVFIHNKDIPTQFENSYYTKGDCDRSHKQYGLAFCWEMLRTKTLKELDDNVRLLLAGSCWWGLPTGSQNTELAEYNRNLNKSLPAVFASKAGLPVVHSSLKGKIWGDRSLSDKSRVERLLIGTTQIVDAHGNVLRMVEDTDDSDCLIIEDILLPEIKPINQCSDEFWLVDLREEYRNAWQTQNALGEKIYADKRIKGSI